jgi:Flp pilus assembly pilin Flp
MNMVNSVQSSARFSFPTNDHGSIMVEYAVLLSAVAIGCSIAVVALGVPLVRMFMAQQVWLMLAVP